MSKPIFKHDCNTCQFLGEYAPGGAPWDLYYCPTTIMGGNLVARYGDEHSQYVSYKFDMLLERGQIALGDAIAEAGRRQIRRWLKA